MADYVHSRPLDILAQPDDDGGPPQFVIPPGADLEALRGGPTVTFEGLWPTGALPGLDAIPAQQPGLHVFVYVRCGGSRECREQVRPDLES
jgi:hypothetical protein